MFDSEWEWDKYFINLCYKIAEKSKDPSTKVGAIITYPDNGVCSTGFNGFARKINEDEDRLNNREQKYKLTIHAELNAILNAVKHGHNTENCKLYVPWHPCSSCANAIVQSGIKIVILDGKFQNKELYKRWEEEIELSKIIFKEGGIVVRETEK